MNFDKLLKRILSLHLKNGERDPRTGEAMGTTRMASGIWFRRQRGITLIELLISLCLTAIIGGALYRGLVNQSKSFVQQDQIAEAMQNCRTATDQILRELRMSGYGMAYMDASNNTINDLGIAVGTRSVINGTVVTTNNDTSRWTTDSLVIRRADGIPWSIRKYKYKYKDKKNEEKTKVTYDERITVRFGDPDYVLLLNVDKTEYRTAKVKEKGLDDEYAGMKKIQIETYTGELDSTNGGAANYEGGICVKFKEIAFYIDTSSGIPTLMKAINGYPSQIVARNIEDLQIAYQTGVYDAGTDTWTWTWYRGGSGTVQTDPPVVNNIRNVRISVLARASTASPRNNYSHEALEDGNRHPVTRADGYIRRSLITQVRARNFGVDIGD
jgi:type II secretory pathway pseudopilin PulG